MVRFSKKKTSPVRRPRWKRRPVRGAASVLNLVREGVERFILRDANMTLFMKAVRTAGKAGENSAHPLTGAEFRRIVREAVRKRKMRSGGSTRTSSKSRRKNSS
jgi:hypothetical protein